MQHGAAWLIAPYLKFDRADDDWLSVNIRCLQVMKAIVGNRSFCAWMYVPLSFFTSGDVELVAQRYASVLPRGATVFLTVCDLDPELPGTMDGSTLRRRYLKDREAVGLLRRSPKEGSRCLLSAEW